MSSIEMPASVDDVLREVSKLKTAVSDAVEDGVRSALKAVENGRRATEDAIHNADRLVKRNPRESVGIAFASGVLLGGLAVWLSLRRD
jgi:ElaB/YqjD/DUF883 family membrane-anchored ribosome-binding protein